MGDDPDGDDPDAEYEYRWQSQAPGSNSWIPVSTTMTAMSKVINYDIPENTPAGTRYRVEVQYTDAQRYDNTKVVGNYLYRAGNADNDGDGFIDIYYLEELAVSGGAAIALNRRSYELRRNLDFNDPDSYADTANMIKWTANDDRSNLGWDPVHPTFVLTHYTFEGNGYTISNLYINRASSSSFENLNIALFRNLGSTGIIRNIVLDNVDVRGFQYVGGLVGINAVGRIESSYVTGSVNISGRRLIAGGLVGFNRGVVNDSYVIATTGTISSPRFTGGLTGFNNAGRIRNSGVVGVTVLGDSRIGGLVGTANFGIVRNSFARGSVTGEAHVGGLIGEVRQSGTRLINSYTAGNVNAGTNTQNLGGLIGLPPNVQTIVAANSYTLSKVIPRGDGTRGGLLGNTFRGNVTAAASYWNSDTYTEGDIRPTDDQSQRTSKTTVQLQSPIDASGIYQQWSAADWDFGDEMSYPMIRYDQNSCDPASNTARCGPLPNQQYETGLGALLVLSNGKALNPDLSLGNQPFSVLRQNYSMAILNQSEVQLRPFAVDDAAEIKIIDASDNRNYFVGKSSGEFSELISLDLDVPTSVSVVVADSDVNTTYTLVMDRYDIETESNRVVDEGTEITLNTNMRVDSLMWSSTPTDLIGISSGQGTSTLRVTIPKDFVPGGAETTSTRLIFEVDIVDGGTTYTPREEFIVKKINSGTPPDISLQVNPTTLSIVLGDGIDEDGEGEFIYTWERLNIDENGAKVSWRTVSDSREYQVPDTGGGSRYRVNVIHTDGQGHVTDYGDQESSQEFIMAPIRVGIDNNSDNLIEIHYLEDLHEIQEHLTEMPQTCGQNSDQPCQGYELRRSLDFDSADSYLGDVNQAWRSESDGEGWQPIGSIKNPFNTIFTASTNTLSISNLYIDREQEDNIGLFGVIGVQAKILDIQVRNPDITGRYAVGGLVGLTSRSTDSEGLVTESSLIANSSVVDSSGNFSIEATHAWVGGMVGSNYGSIVNSYTQVGVKGGFAVGGLAGYSFGPISDSYALSAREAAPTFDIDGTDGGIAIGGLVGYNHNEAPFAGGGFITNSYANIRVEGDFNVGGLVGYNDAGTIDNGYALGNVVGATNVGGLVGYSIAGTITGYAGNNVTGGTNVGDLLPSEPESSNIVTELSNTPALMYTSDFNNNGYSSCAVADGETDYRVKLPACGTPLPGQNTASRVGLPAVSSITLSVGTLEPPFSPTIFNYEIFDIPENEPEITVSATKDNPDSVLAIGLLGNVMPEDVTLRTFVLQGIGTISLSTNLNSSGREYRIATPTRPKLSDEPKTPCDASNRDSDGDGLIEICDLEGLYEIHTHLDGIPSICGGSNNNDACRGYELMTDLDFNDNGSYRAPATNRPIWTEGNGWRPIGNPAQLFNAEFSATTNHSIANLMINRSGSHYAGLFGHTGRNARIINIRLPGANVRSKFLAGGLVGRNEGTIINSDAGSATSTSTIVATHAWSGGLVGDNDGLINDSYTRSNVSGRNWIGGLAGINTGQIINSISDGNVQGATFAGGLVGVNARNIDNSYATSSVGENFYYAGGLVGLNVGSINNTYALGDVTGSERVGGLVGDNRNLIASSYVTNSNVLGTRLVGELVGINSGSIIDSYVGQSVQSDYGLIGENLRVGTIRNSEIISDMDLQSRSSIAGWSPESWDFGTNKQYPGLKYLQSEVDLPGCEQCGMLLQGQPARPKFSLRVPEGELAILIETAGGYVLRVRTNTDQVSLIPLIEDVENPTITYRLDSGAEQTVQNGQTFSVTLTPASRTITITVQLQDDEMISYIVDVRRAIFTQVRVLLEGLLNP